MRARPLGLALLLAGALGVSGCLGGDGPAPPTSPVDGVVTAVAATSLTDIQAFDLRVPGGVTLTFKLGPLENATQFSPGHLKEHQATGSPVRVYFTTSGSTYTAYRLEDAPGSSSSP